MQDKIFFNLYKILVSKEVLLLRALIFVALTIILLLFIDEYQVLIRILPVYFVLFLQELFIHYKLEKKFPAKNVNSTENLVDAMFFDIRKNYLSSQKSSEIIKEILLTKRGKFILERINPDIKIGQIDVNKEDILNKSAGLVKILNGKYISSLDFFIAYLLLQEENSKIMQENNLNEKDLIIILYWARKKFNIEKSSSRTLSFNGQGAFDFLVYGWTPETNNFTSDFTSEVLRLGYTPKAIGRDKEYRVIIEGLSKSSSKNILIIGDPGVGKTNLVMKFAYDAYKGNLTKGLKNKRVYFLFIDRLISGAQNKGELEQRVLSVFTEISHSGNVIILIENIENIFGGGGFDFDISGAIQPYLEGSNVQIIGTTNQKGYKDFIVSKPSIQNLFSEIEMDAPSKEVATFMLIEEVDIREKLSGSIITFSAVKETIELADVYAPDLSLPGSSVKLLEDSMVRNFQSGKNILTLQNVREIVNDRTGVNLSVPTQEEKGDLLNMEEEIHKKLIGQETAVNAVSNALRRLRSGMRKKQGPIASFLFLGPTGVGKTTTAKLLAKQYFGSEDKMIRVDMSEYQSNDSIKKLLGEMPGEESFSSSFVDKIHENPFSLVLLDEFEKANPRLLDVFLQILDEGYVTNNKGKKIAFKNTIIIATSNAGSEFIRERIEDGKNIKNELTEYILTKGIFKPELVNRFDDVIIFNPLSKEEILKITELRLTELKEKLEEQYIDISFSDNVIDKVSTESFDADFGARNVRRYIEDNIENLVSRMILEEKIKKGEKILVNLDEQNKFIIEK
jgi:ATP-dependent Clp protease ATP-binding subunit ClpC